MDWGVQTAGTITGKGRYTEGYPICELRPISGRSKSLLTHVPLAGFQMPRNEMFSRRGAGAQRKDFLF